MKYVTVPPAITPRNFDDTLIFFWNLDEKGERTRKDIGEVDMHRCIMEFWANERVLDQDNLNEQKQPKDLGAKLSMNITKGNWDVKSANGYLFGKRHAKLERLFGDAKAGDEVAVEDELYGVVKKIAEEKDYFSAAFAGAFVVFAEAWIDNAKDESRTAATAAPPKAAAAATATA